MNSASTSIEDAHVELYQIMQQDTEFDQKAQQALELGKRTLGVENAHLTRIDQDTDFWQAIVSTDPPDGTFPPGLTLDYQSTYCRRVIDKESSIALHDAPAQGWADDPAFETHGLHCYHGTPIALDEDIYGTVCFVSKTARDEPFTDSETLFAELIARLLEHELERNRTEKEMTLRANSITVLSRVLRHNLRNEMSIVRGRINLLLDSLPEQSAPDFDESLLESIDRIIDLSDKARKLESVVSTHFDKEPIALAPLLDRLRTTLDTDDLDADITIEGATDVTIEAMPSLELAVTELVENAVTHAGEDPTVVVRVEATPETVDLHVIDNGPGLPEQEREVLDEGVETPLIHGSGLGLWMVYWVVTTHDGSIDTTVTEEGTTVTVTLPRRQEASTTDDQTVQTLQRGRDRFEAVFEESFDAMVLLNDDRRIIHVNEQAAEVFGRSQNDLLGLPLDEFAGEAFDLGEAWLELQGTGAHKGEFPLVRADGTERTIEYSATVDIVPGQHLIIGRDITERREQERALKRSEQRYRTLAENLPNGAVLVFDTDLRYQHAHGEIFSLVDSDPTDYEEKHISEVFEGETLDIKREMYEATLSGESRDREMEFAGRVYQVYTLPIHDEDGDIYAGLVLTWDITKYKQREQELERQNERLEEFANVVSHDLRNPLNMAEGWLELAREDDEDAYFDEVEHAHERMHALIDDLLTIAREGEPVSERDPVALAALSERCWRNVDTMDATLTTDTAQTIWADSSRLQQVLENLFRNAVEHGGETVTITVGELEDGFYVADDGPGIPEDDRNTVFTRGYSTSEGGTGFGLAIVKEIVDAHEWSIDVTESETGGARFEITGVEVIDG